jgi:hypothetical protein
MNPEELLKLLQRIYVWLPKNNYMRTEVQNIIDQIKAQRR